MNLSIIKESIRAKSYIIPLSIATGVVVGGCLMHSGKKNRLYRKSRISLPKKMNYEYYLQKSFERLGLDMNNCNWEKIAQNNAEIENMLKYHSLIVNKISYLRNKSQEDNVLSKDEKKFLEDSKSADKVFFNLLHKYSVFLLREKKTVVVS